MTAKEMSTTPHDDPPPTSSGRRLGARAGNGAGKAIDLVARLVRLVGATFAVLLAGHALLTVFEANPANAVTRFFAEYSGPLTLWFERLFILDDPKLTIVVGYGLAAIFWLVVAAVVARLLRAVRPRTRSGVV